MVTRKIEILILIRHMKINSAETLNLKIQILINNKNHYKMENLITKAKATLMAVEINKNSGEEIQNFQAQIKKEIKIILTNLMKFKSY